MKIAAIGLGDIAVKAHLPVLTQLENVEWVFCTRNPERLQRLTKKYHVTEAYTDYADLVKADIDAVMIHSATVSHPVLAAFFLNLGLPVFVDKPLADNYEQCERLYDLAERKQTPLFMGFNRRYIPLYKTHLPGLAGVHALPETQPSSEPLLSLRWEKHRHDLPGETRSFIFDDFIHPLDSINLNASIAPEELYITTQSAQNVGRNLLGRLDVQWQQGETLFHASMNRQHGATMETVTANYRNASYRFDSFAEGSRWLKNKEERIKLADWTPMLAAKGFHAMAEHWLDVVRAGKQSLSLTQRNVHSHLLAEHVVRQLSKE
ncbi:gfo/Idh/MocA family oxidoreductase [Photobacterium gaetbulicola]|uniref:Gfo/Idh/MocA family oxidoreductase n=1 Tax=Photobacterium gaetbulicola Gung47 TaxID=658445 RepID=A0A0C5WUP4_9GAMM|nr:Gfo/Idh/MocA family oxidoreductase [Photobacterium gaetbulicola]AJR08759.1 Gfo/Idh/MocA family oxidoreductase [Photobacterium gaetbulicola Gung47]PSU10390.1 gfo/Idh/MocA family oxidoreductase [Photobacterium gaetbulicola]